MATVSLDFYISSREIIDQIMKITMKYSWKLIFEKYNVIYIWNEISTCVFVIRFQR